MCTPVLNFREVRLLNLNLCACSLELLLDGLSLFLRSLLNVKLGLLSSSGSAAVSGSSNSYSSSCAYAKLILYSVYELGKLENGEAL